MLEWRGWTTTFQYEWSDPRLPSEILSYNNGSEYVLQGRSASERGGHIRGTAIGHGPDGSWEGPFTGLYPDTVNDVRNWMVLTGSGAYEGLYAIITARQWYDADAMEHRHEVEALIAEGRVPVGTRGPGLVAHARLRPYTRLVAEVVKRQTRWP